MAAREVRERVGHDLLDLLGADYFGSFVWDDCDRRFGDGVFVSMSADNVARYDSYYQNRDPITLKLQGTASADAGQPGRGAARADANRVFQRFPGARRLYWGVNVYSFAGESNIGDLRIWRGRRRENFDRPTLELLRLVEPAFIGALVRAQGRQDAANAAPSTKGLSRREYEIAEMIAQGPPDKVIAERLGIRFSTVRTYCERIFDELAVGRLEADDVGQCPRSTSFERPQAL